jgi:hypothetical protein
LSPLIEAGWVYINYIDPKDKPEAWTDDYINILSPIILKFVSK